MVIYCCIKDCKSSKYKRVKDKGNIIPLNFFGFPKNPDLRDKWIEILVNNLGHNQEHTTIRISKSSRICSLHFAEDCIESIGFSSSRLKPNSVPTRFLNASSESTIDIENKSFNTQSIKTENVDQYERNIYENVGQRKENIYENIDQHEENIESVQSEVNIPTTPSKKRICYAGDVKFEKIEKMSPKTLIKSMKILKKSCQKKDKVINRLKVLKSNVAKRKKLKAYKLY